MKKVIFFLFVALATVSIPRDCKAAITQIGATATVTDSYGSYTFIVPDPEQLGSAMSVQSFSFGTIQFSITFPGPDHRCAEGYWSNGNIKVVIVIKKYPDMITVTCYNI